MICRSCGHQIADNAIVCYKCGTPTEMPAPAVKPRPVAPRRSRMLAGSVFAGLVAFEVWGLTNTGHGTAAQWALWAALVATAVSAVAGLWRR